MLQKASRLVCISLVLLLPASLLVELTVTRATPLRQSRSTSGARGAKQVGELFRSNCARCHGAEGRGDTPLGITYKAPDFTDPEWWQKHSKTTTTASLVSIVTHGKGGMPSFGKKLKRAEIRSLVGYVRRFKNQKPTN